VLSRDHPHRAIALVTASHALIFRHNPSAGASTANGSFTSIHSLQSQGSTSGTVAPRCMVEFSELDSVDISDYQAISPLPVLGTLGLITINNDVFLCVVTGATCVAVVRPGETVQRIHAVEFRT
jgi:hypothetical protein